MILAASIGSRIYAEFAARTGSWLYIDGDGFPKGFHYAAPFLGPYLAVRYGFPFQVAITWAMLFGIGFVAWRRCIPWLTYSLVGGVAIFVLVGELLWIRIQPDARGRSVPLGLSIDMAGFPPFARAIASSQAMTVFEGLPRNWGHAEPDQNRSMFKSHGHQFYTSPVSVSADDAATLLRLASTPSSFHEWRGMKMCFGFHPDWMIRWISSDGATHELQLCFGCGEAKVYSTADSLYCEFQGAAQKEFRTILGQYATPRAVKKEP